MSMITNTVEDKPHRRAMIKGWEKELAENIRDVSALLERRKTIENCIKGMKEFI